VHNAIAFSGDDRDAVVAVRTPVAQVRSHPVHMAELDVPATPAIAAQEVHLEGVILDDRLQVSGPARRAMLQRVPERVVRADVGVVRLRHVQLPNLFGLALIVPRYDLVRRESMAVAKRGRKSLAQSSAMRLARRRRRIAPEAGN
jgi:hypothetical protein